MLATRYRKVIRDLTSNKARTLLVVAAVAVGVIAFGSVFITQELLLKNMRKEYLENKGSNITLYLSEFDEAIVKWARSEEGVAEAQGTAAYNAKLVKEDGKEESLVVTARPNYGEQRLNLLTPKSGEWPPARGELVVERSAVPVVGAGRGEPVTIKVGEKEYRLNMGGVVYDNGAFPYMFTNQVNAYVAWDTLGQLGLAKRYNRLEIKTDGGVDTLEQAEQVAARLAERLEDRQIRVGGQMVLPPNEHWAENNSRAFTAILSIIGVFSLLLSGFLVVNTISALLSEQRRQIGIMKAIGGKSGQVTGLYLLTVGIYGLLGLLLAVPLSMLLGYFFFRLVANFLNLDVVLVYLPWQVLLMEVAASLAIPLVAAVWPIARGAKRPIREALAEVVAKVKGGRLEEVLAKVGGLSRPTLLSLRNVFRKRGRVILTMGTLVVAGAVFMGVINVRLGMYREMDRLLSLFDFEVAVQLSGEYDRQAVLSRVQEVPRVSAAEARTYLSVKRVKDDGSLGSEFTLTGLPAMTLFSHPTVLSGRWLQPGDGKKVVVGSSLREDYPELTTGEQIAVETPAGKRETLEVVGVVVTSSQEKLAFAEFEAVATLKDKPNLVSGVMLKTEPTDGATQREVGAAVEERLKRAGIVVGGKQTKEEIYSSAASQFNFLIFFLLSMSVMVAVVGGLGLAGTMSLNVLERTREIGIMRSLGAGDQAVRRVVLLEGVLVGVMSFVLAVPLSLPLTYGFDYAIGTAFFERVLPFAVVPSGMGIWLAIVLVIAVVASVVPARRASRIPISETLAYE